MWAVSKKSGKIATLIDDCRGKGMDAHYLGYFECFNRQLFYEAHDVLEELWLAQRNQPNDLFFKGLIQLAGAFVHLQKERLVSFKEVLQRGFKVLFIHSFQRVLLP